jgi:hypothetical protein
MEFKTLIPQLGYFGLSAGVPFTSRLTHVREVNAEIDIMNWPEGKILPTSTVCDMIIEQLKSRRMGEVPIDRPIGILTHHRVFDEWAWDFVSKLFQFFSHRSVKVDRADTLFGPHLLS